MPYEHPVTVLGGWTAVKDTREATIELYSTSALAKNETSSNAASIVYIIGGRSVNVLGGRAERWDGELRWRGGVAKGGVELRRRPERPQPHFI